MRGIKRHLASRWKSQVSSIDNPSSIFQTRFLFTLFKLVPLSNLTCLLSCYMYIITIFLLQPTSFYDISQANISRRLRHMFWFVLSIAIFAWIFIALYISKENYNKTITEDYLNETCIDINLKYIDLIRNDCGKLCNTSRQGIRGRFFDYISSEVNCRDLFLNPYIDQSHGCSEAPKSIPSVLISDFTMGYKLRIEHLYFDQQYLGKKAMVPVWTHDLIENWISLARTGKLHGTYGIKETNALRDGLRHAPFVKNGRILVIGSERPWVEACCLEAGANEVVTLEYGGIVSLHSKVKTVIPADFRLLFLNNSLGEFDAIVTFSSVEHSGLGRYGDMINPWGDMISLARGWCVTKDGGSLTLGVMYNYDNEYIEFNAHRWYGKIRYPYLTTNWKQLYKGTGEQLVHVFVK